jgi:hypothetical protein
MDDRCERAEVLARLREEIPSCRRLEWADRLLVSTGWATLDRVLNGGICRGSLVELLDSHDGGGAETVAAILTKAACPPPCPPPPRGEGKGWGLIVVVDRDGEFYPPALAAWGVPVERLLVVRPENDADALWAADQALRSTATAAVWLRRDRLLSHDFRRLQLSAAEGGGLGLLLRPIRVRGQPTWADVQLAVEPRRSVRGRKLHIEVTRCRGGVPGTAAEIELDGVTGCEIEEGRREASPLLAAAALVGPAAVG